MESRHEQQGASIRCAMRSDTSDKSNASHTWHIRHTHITHYARHIPTPSITQYTLNTTNHTKYHTKLGRTTCQVGLPFFYNTLTSVGQFDIPPEFIMNASQMLDDNGDGDGDGDGNGNGSVECEGEGEYANLIYSVNLLTPNNHKNSSSWQRLLLPIYYDLFSTYVLII